MSCEGWDVEKTLLTIEIFLSKIRYLLWEHLATEKRLEEKAVQTLKARRLTFS